MLMTGKVLRFDEVRGYGFIAPSGPGEDVFMHANDLLDEKYLYKEGSEVEFFMETGEKGPKASQIRLVYQPSGNRIAQRPASAGPEESESAEDFRGELTDALVDSVDTLTAVQIRQVRSCVMELITSRGWVAP